MKSVRIRSFFGAHFPTFWLNTNISPYSIQMRENTEQKNFDYGHFSRSIIIIYLFIVDQ